MYSQTTINKKKNLVAIDTEKDNNYSAKNNNSLGENDNSFEKDYNHVLLKKFEHSNDIKHFSPFNKQWKNSVYFFNKQDLSIASVKQQITDTFVKSYLNAVPSVKRNQGKSKRMRDYIARLSINNIYVSNPEMKQTNDRLYITVYIYDRKKYHFLKKLYFINKNTKTIFYDNKANTMYKKYSKFSWKILNKNSLLLNKINKTYSKSKFNKTYSVSRYNTKYYRNNKRFYEDTKKKRQLKKDLNSKYNNKKIFRKEKFLIRKNNKNILRKRRALIRKNLLKQLKFNQLKFFNLKKNIITNFIKNFSRKFWISFSQNFFFKFSWIKGKLILRIPKNFLMIEPNFYKFNSSEKLLTVKNIQNMESYIRTINYFSSTTYFNYMFFNTFNLVPTSAEKLIVINMKLNSSSKKIKKIKEKIVSILLTNIIRKLIINSLAKLYGIKFARTITFGLWKQKFDHYYENFLKTRILKQIISLNKLMFNRDFFYSKGKFNISILKTILGHFYNKKIILNIVNTKYLHLSSDNYMEAIKAKLRKRKSKLLSVLRKSLKLVKLPKITNQWISSFNIQNKIAETNLKYNSNDILYNFEKYNNQDYSLNQVVSNNILENIKYKFTTGVRLEAKGRLTKRYTASRALFKYKYKGNLKNLEFSKKNPDDIVMSPNMAMIRGYNKPNVQHTFVNGIRRIGVFGIKGWISGN